SASDSGWPSTGDVASSVMAYGDSDVPVNVGIYLIAATIAGASASDSGWPSTGDVASSVMAYGDSDVPVNVGIYL
ncbi:hypothetical protein CTI14_70475, partial [Methylobacterium radiotolerans]